MAQTIAPTLRERYAHEIAARGYRPDGPQSAAVEALDALRSRLIAAGAGTGAGAPGLLRWLPARWRLRNAEAVPGIYLWGPVGRGKTWLMDLFYDSLPPRGRQRSHFHHFMRDVHRLLGQLRGRPDPLALVAARVARGTRLLCLDELYVSDIADAMILGQLFENLLARGTTLVITANTPPAELYRGGLQRSRFLPAIALLERALQVVSVDAGVDYRLRQLSRRPLYFDSRAPQTTEQLRQLMKELAGVPTASATDVTLQGRRLRAVARGSGVIWFGFAALCEGPRHQDDYAELAQEFHTVLLSDVPAFELPQQDNAARRFIALVDELYDQGVKLILSAAAPPQQLYRGEALQFEFRRAASRLIEMQSELYLARAHHPRTQSLADAAPEQA